MDQESTEIYTGVGICAACHGPDGTGAIGPDLTDAEWLIGDGEYDPADRVSIIYDNRMRLEDRIARLNSGAAYAQEPKSHVRRVISNIEIAPEEKPGEVVVHSNMVIGEVRRGLQTVYIARQTHVLRPAGDSFKIALKKVMLVNRDEALHNLTFLI